MNFTIDSIKQYKSLDFFYFIFILKGNRSIIREMLIQERRK